MKAMKSDQNGCVWMAKDPVRVGGKKLKTKRRDGVQWMPNVSATTEDRDLQCCHYGSVELPAFLPCPDEIESLLQGASRKGRHSRGDVRNYNRAMAFASMGAPIALPASCEPYCFRIPGQVYYRIGHLYTEADMKTLGDVITQISPLAAARSRARGDPSIQA